MVIRVYVASSSGSVAINILYPRLANGKPKQNCRACHLCFQYGHEHVKKHQQAVVGFLESNRINFEEVDITMLEDQRLWMYQNIPEKKQPEKGNPLPPQIFNGDDYCGDYEDFFQSKETNTVSLFLRLSSQPSVKDYES